MQYVRTLPSKNACSEVDSLTAAVTPNILIRTLQEGKRFVRNRSLEVPETEGG
jgi:hypothetical protein